MVIIHNVPNDFDGQKFMDKFNVSFRDFRINENGLVCDTLNELTENDIADCVTDWETYNQQHSS